MMELTGWAVPLFGDRILCMEKFDAEGDGHEDQSYENRQAAP